MKIVKRIPYLLVAFLMLASAGCAAGQWDEFFKDLRGDNMKMQYDFAGNKK